MSEPSVEAQGPLVPGLTRPRILSLERFAIRLRESGVTHSAWRLSLSADEGEGAIVLVEITADRPIYRGEGVLLGWTQERLEAAYRLLLPGGSDPEPDPGQAG